MDIVEILGKIGFDTKIFIFNLINFTILALLLKKFFFGKMASVLNERKKIIDEGVKHTQFAEAELNSSKLKSEEIIKEAKDKSRDIVKESTNQAAEMSENIKKEARDEAKVIVEKAQNLAEQEKKSVLETIKKDAAQLIVSEVANKLATDNK